MASEALNYLNNSESYYTLKRYSDLVIGKQYKVLSFEMKKNQYGKRICLMLQDLTAVEGEDPESFLYYLSPSFAEPKKHESLELLMKQRGHCLLFKLEKIKEKESCVLPIYKFESIRNESMEKIMDKKNFADVTGLF